MKQVLQPQSSASYVQLFGKLCGILAVLPGLVVAQEADEVFVHTAYLKESTNWCLANQGVPVEISVDGPVVYGADYPEPARITVRRGGDAERVEVGEVGFGKIRANSGLDRSHTSEVGALPDEIALLGRFKAEFRVCISLWDRWFSGAGTWRVVREDGSTHSAGTFDGKTISRQGHPLLFLPGYKNSPLRAKLGDELFIIAQEPTIVRTKEAFASPAKEQSQ